MSELALPISTADGQARAQALKAFDAISVTPTSLVAYTSTGRTLIIGAGAATRAAAARLADSALALTLLIDDRDGEAASENSSVREILAPVAEIRGHLGAFEVDVVADDEVRSLAPSVLTGNQPFDLIVDLRAAPAFAAEVLPPGYYHCATDADALDAVVAELPEMTGEFEKPRYFNYDPDICAHGKRGLSGCNRCITACPTLAITSLGEQIAVDPYLCQGGGSCATACPSGAITYAYPRASDLVDRLRSMLSVFLDAGGQRPVVLLHDTEQGLAWLEDNAQTLPEPVHPVMLEELGSAGMDVWLSAISFGATRVVLLAHAGVPQSVREELNTQLGVANDIINGLGLADAQAPRLVIANDSDDVLSELRVDAMAPLAAAGFAGVGDKRGQLRLALDHLHSCSAAQPHRLSLSVPAPFGEIQVDQQACTLCFGCASVCPAKAVLAGGDRPELHFVEQNCVQCGLCETACPEQAISLVPGLLFDQEARAARRVLMEDEPFACVSCGKIFGTTRTVEHMRSKLASHWMYKDKPEQLARLEMCDECRVKDMFRNGGGMLDPHSEA